MSLCVCVKCVCRLFFLQDGGTFNVTLLVQFTIGCVLHLLEPNSSYGGIGTAPCPKGCDRAGISPSHVVHSLAPTGLTISSVKLAALSQACAQ